MEMRAESFLAGVADRRGRGSRGGGGRGAGSNDDNFSDIASIVSYCSGGSRTGSRGGSGRGTSGILSCEAQLMKEIEEEKEQVILIQDLINKSYDPNTGLEGVEAVPWAKFLVINFLSYGLDMRKKQMPCEWALTEWNIMNGIGKSEWGLLDIGEIPPATGYDIKRSAGKTKCPIPPFKVDDGTGEPIDCDFDKEVLMKIEQSFQSHGFNLDNGEPGLVFTLRSNIDKVWGCLGYACERAERPINIRILPFELLAQYLFSIGAQKYMTKGDMTKSVPHRGPDGKIIGPKTETDILAMVSQPHYQSVLDLTCLYHKMYDNCDGMDYCPMSENKRMIFSVLESLPDYFGITKYLGKHYPRQDVVPIEHELTTQEESDQEIAPGPTGALSESSCPSNPMDDDSSVDYSTITSISGSLVDFPTSNTSQTTTSNKSAAAAFGGPRRSPCSAREFHFLSKHGASSSCSSSTMTVSEQLTSSPATAATREPPSPLPSSSTSDADEEKTQESAKIKLPNIVKPTQIPMESKRVTVKVMTPLDTMLIFLQRNPMCTPENFHHFVEEFDVLQKAVHKYNTQTYPQKIAQKVVSHGGLRHDSVLAPGVMFWDLGVGKKNENTGNYLRKEAPGDGPIPLFNSYEKAKVYDKYCNLLKLRRKMLKKLVEEEQDLIEIFNPPKDKEEPETEPTREDDEDGDDDNASHSTMYFNA